MLLLLTLSIIHVVEELYQVWVNMSVLNYISVFQSMSLTT